MDTELETQQTLLLQEENDGAEDLDEDLEEEELDDEADDDLGLMDDGSAQE